MLDLGGVGEFLLGIAAITPTVVSGFGAFAAWGARTEARAAHRFGKAAAVIADEVRVDMKELAVNTNSKMDATIEAIKAEGAAHAIVTGLEGEKAGIATGVAQEVARQNKETT
jgi:hypothetical protein